MVNRANKFDGSGPSLKSREKGMSPLSQVFCYIFFPAKALPAVLTLSVYKSVF